MNETWKAQHQVNVYIIVCVVSFRKFESVCMFVVRKCVCLVPKVCVCVSFKHVCVTNDEDDHGDDHDDGGGGVGGGDSNKHFSVQL